MSFKVKDFILNSPEPDNSRIVDLGAVRHDFPDNIPRIHGAFTKLQTQSFTLKMTKQQMENLTLILKNSIGTFIPVTDHEDIPYQALLLSPTLDFITLHDECLYIITLEFLTDFPKTLNISDTISIGDITDLTLTTATEPQKTLTVADEVSASAVDQCNVIELTCDDDFSGDLSLWTIDEGSPVTTGGQLWIGDNKDNHGQITSDSTLTGDFDVQIKVYMPLVSVCSTMLGVQAKLLFTLSGAIDAEMRFNIYDNTSAEWKVYTSGDISASTVDYSADTVYFKFVRSGSTLTSYYSTNGTSWTLHATGTVNTGVVTVILGCDGTDSAFCDTYDMYFDDYVVNEGCTL